VLAAGAGWRRLEALKLRPAVAAAIVLAIAADLALWDLRFLKTEETAPFLRGSPAFAAAVGGAPRRLMTDPALANTDKTMLYRAMNVNGYEAFYLAGYPEYAARSEGRPAADPSRTYLSRADTPEMRRLGVAFFLSADGTLSPTGRPAPLAYFVDRAGRLIGESPTLSIPRPERWTAVGAPPPGAARLVLAQPLYPGWRAWLDGRPAVLQKWDGLLQSVSLAAAGSGRELALKLVFAPTGWPLWVAWTCLAWLFWLGFWLRGPAWA